MAIDKRFLYYTTEAGFLNDKNSGNIDSKSIAFISANGKRAIYTHGKFFSAEAFVVGTQGSSTNAFTGTFDETDGLYDGLNIRYWLPYSGTTSEATLNLTINGTETGAIPVYIKGTTRFTNHIGGTNVLDLTYREGVSGIEKGWWVLGSYGDASDGNTEYTFISGESGSFKVKPSNGTEQEISIGKPETAGTADKVSKNFVVQINSGAEEYVNKYTYDGSAAKTLNIIEGNNISFGVEDGELIINGAYTEASETTSGLMSSNDKKKLNSISEGAEVNQNAFGKIIVDSNTIEANEKIDSLNIAAGSNITLAVDTENDEITISAKDTTYANATTSKDGLMSSTDKEKLDGIEDNANNYTHPEYTEYAFSLYKIKVNKEGHVESATGVTKSDITNLGIPAQDTTYDVMTGATSSIDGVSGLVPTPEAGENELYLRGDGTWATPTNYTHPTYVALTGKPTEDATPEFGETFTVSQITSNTLGHITGATDRTITIPDSVATTNSSGLMSAADKYKLDGITAGANKYVLPKATTSTLGGIKIAKDNESYTVTTNTSSIYSDITSGKYYGVELDKDNKAFVYVPWTDNNTTTTTGSTNKVDNKMYLIGATTQETAPTTYSNSKVYIGEDNCLYSNGTKVSIDGHIHSQYLTSVTAHTQSYTTLTGSGTIENQAIVSSGTENGWTLLTLGSAAQEEVTTSVTSGSSALVTSGAVYIAINNSFAANDAMVFKGTLGTEGDITSLPTTHKIGWTYRVITAGTYAGIVCEVGDLIICITDGTAANNAHWTVAQTNIDGAVVGPSGVTTNTVAIFNGTSGKVIKSSGYTIGCSVPSKAKFTDTVYTHPTFTAKGSGLYKITVDGEGHVSSATAVVKTDITNLGIPGSDTTYSIGDYDTAGLIKPWKSYTVSCSGPTAATTATAVSVNSISSTPGRYYAVEMDKDGRAFVNVPWVDTSKYILPTATTSALGGVIVSNVLTTAVTLTSGDGTTASRYYGVQIDKDGKAFVNVPWSTGSDINVTTTATNPTSATTWYFAATASAATATGTLVKNSGAYLRTYTGTTSAEGYNYIILGNSTAVGTAGNSTGNIRLYSSSTSYHNIKGASTSSAITHTLPAITGIILNTGTTSITAEQTTGVHIATLKINSIETKLYAPSQSNLSLGLGNTGTTTTAGTLVSSISVNEHTVTMIKYNGTVGSTTEPVYFKAGVPTKCSTYAGGTAVTLNGVDSSASTAEFYAPIAAGTSGQVLVSTGNVPGWKNVGEVGVVSKTVSSTITTDWVSIVTAANMATYCPAAGTYAIQVSGSNIGVSSGIFSWNTSGTTSDEILLHRTGASTNIYLRLSSRALQIAGSAAISTAFTITIKVKRLI